MKTDDSLQTTDGGRATDDGREFASGSSTDDARSEGAKPTLNEFLQAIFPSPRVPEERIELRLLKDGKMTSRMMKQVSDAARFALNADDDADVYFGVGLRHGG